MIYIYIYPELQHINKNIEFCIPLSPILSKQSFRVNFCEYGKIYAKNDLSWLKLNMN